MTGEHILFGDEVHFVFSCCVTVPKCLGILGDLQDVRLVAVEAI